MMTTEANWLARAQDAAAARVLEILSRPLSEDNFGTTEAFDPWDIFPSVYGSYSSDFDECALDVLCELRDKKKIRDDLGAKMLREIFCTSELCDYGVSPRSCFATLQFGEVLPALIEKWNDYARLAWGPEWKKRT